MQQQTYQIPNWNQMMSGWNAFANPTRCPVCGGTHTQTPAWAATGTDWLSNLSEMPVVKEWNRMWGGMLDPWIQGMRHAAEQPQHYPHQQHHEWHTAQPRHDGCRCSCSCCQPDDCHCRCCVVNADLLVYARLGESRLVPVTIENNIRREREVAVELSDWTTNSKQAVRVVGQVNPNAKFTLKPCEERTVSILVQVLPDANQPNTVIISPSEAAGAGADQAREGTVGQQFVLDSRRESLPDVDECVVFYADLRLKGCDIRPIRIALAVMSRVCDAYRIGCQCGCC